MPIASDIMSTTLLALEANTTLGEAIQQLVAHGYSAAPVLQDGKLVGIVSELELFDVLFDPSLRNRPVSEVMETEVIAVDESEPLGRVAHLFALNEIRRVPVLRAGAPVGVVSRRDLLRFAANCDEPLIDPLAELMTYMDEELALADQG
jgi:CBS domain-containing protein